MISANRISKSLVDCYEFCPYKAKLWLDKVPPTDPKSHAMQRGKWIHDVFEKFYSNINKDNINKTFKESHSCGLFETFTDTCNSIKDTNLLDANKDIENFATWNVQQYLADKENFFPLYVEEKIYLPDEDIVGVIDRVDKCNGKIRVIDYKSGNSKNKDIANYRFELSIYAHLIEKQHNILPDQWGIYFSDSNTLLLEDINKTYYDHWATRKIEKFKHAIKMDEFPKTEWAAGCRECEYFSHCWR